MSASLNFTNQVPLLPTSRKFPQDLPLLEKELTKMYLDIAQAVNARMIANFTVTPSLNGDMWDSSQLGMGTNVLKRSTYRQVFNFGTIIAGATLNIPHGIPQIIQFTHIYGTCITNVVDYRPIPYSDVALVTNQISVKCDNTNIIIMNGATAPNITSGTIILEWLVQR